MRPPTRADGAASTIRPQRQPDRLSRLQPRSTVPVLRGTLQPQGSSQESTSHTALRQPATLGCSSVVTVPQQTSVMLESEKLIMVFETGKELTGNPSSSGPTRFRLPLRFLLVGSGVDLPLSADLSTSKKGQNDLGCEPCHCVSFVMGSGADLPLSRIHSQHFF